MKSKQIKSSLLLLLCAVIWGAAFSVQSAGMKYMGAFSFNAIRNFIGAAALLPLVVFSKEKSESGKILLTAGVVCGALLGVASCLQQYGLVYTSAGKAGFITALYIIIIPVTGVFTGKRCSWLTWIAVLMAVAGVYLLCMSEKLTINRGDVFVFMCAFVFAAQIMCISRFSHRVNAYRFACLEFLTAGAVSLIFMLFAKENVSFAGIYGALPSLLFLGIFSSGVGYTLQIISERDLNPTVAALIMSLESCISAISGWILLGQSLTAREIIGCLVMFAAIILAQLKQPK